MKELTVVEENSMRITDPKWREFNYKNLEKEQKEKSYARIYGALARHEDDWDQRKKGESNFSFGDEVCLKGSPSTKGIFIRHECGKGVVIFENAEFVAHVNYESLLKYQ